MDKIKKFMGIFPNAFSAEFCKGTIEYLNNIEKLGGAYTRQEQNSNTLKTAKDDTSVDLTYDNECVLKSYALLGEFNQVFWEKYHSYASEYAILNELAPHQVYNSKIQRTRVGGGYHVWHCEHDCISRASRVLAYIVYLNTVDEGGETEFLYYPKRVAPVEGTLVIFPAAFTHTHRGNPPLSNTKYVLTGWVEFNR